MESYDSIFELAKKTAKALSNKLKPLDLKESNLFTDSTKNRIFKELSEEVVKEEVSKLKKIDVDKDWEHILPKLQSHKKSYNKIYYKVAAVVILFISIGYLTIYFTNQPNYIEQIDPQIVAGTDKAILTLEDSSQVALHKGVSYKNELVTNNGERLDYRNSQNHSKTAFNYLTVPRGGKYQIVLSDGTKVWLNADTKLKYPVIFKDGKTRKVELLYGEAYFDVSPSSKHEGATFKVICNKQEIEVLGTEFNIKAYKDELHIYTTLVEGMVDVMLENNDKEHLIPGEQSSLNIQTKHLAKHKVDIVYEIAWVKGFFNFKDKSLKEIMMVLSRWYDVEIYFESTALENVEFSGLLNRKQSIEDILNGIQNIKFINAYEIKNKTITIK